MTHKVQTITPIINPDQSVTLHLTGFQFREIEFAIQSLNKRRETSRTCMAPKRSDPNKAPKAVKPIITFSWPERPTLENTSKPLTLNVSPAC